MTLKDDALDTFYCTININYGNLLESPAMHAEQISHLCVNAPTKYNATRCKS